MLKINRAAASNKSCSYPSCGEKDLQNASRDIRYELLKNSKFYIPRNSRVCLLHSDYDIWPEHIRNTNLPFTTEQIEDMIDLLCLEPKTKQSNQGMCVQISDLNHRIVFVQVQDVLFCFFLSGGKEK